jgi:uncharacterized protein YydD (DUF2326 family)
VAQNRSKLSEKIAKQIAQIAKESVRIDIEIVQFLKEDFEEIRRAAKERGVSFAELLAEILDGIRKGLVEGGVESLEMVKDILKRSRTELEDLEKQWKERNA